VITDGTGTLNKSGELQEIKKGDVVYIAKNAKHALKNNGKETLKFYWIFPTDTFSEVEYFINQYQDVFFFFEHKL
jgi:quercetin dioxygenase-like cupin family protein